MKQQQVIQKKQEIRQKTAQHIRKSQVPDQDHPYLQAQGLIGNHGMLRRHSGVIQAKLKVSPPGDKYEQEADRVAEQVMRMPEPVLQRQPEEEELIQTRPLAGQITPLIQRQEENEEEEEPIQTKKADGHPLQVTSSLESQIHSVKEGGQPLTEPIRAFFESRFGYDFSRVRLHDDARAAESARALNAQAFTLGSNVVFGAGKYTPGTPVGRRLLAHELTHVVQQQSQPSSMLSMQRIQRQGEPDERTPSWLRKGGVSRGNLRGWFKPQTAVVTLNLVITTARAHANTFKSQVGDACGKFEEDAMKKIDTLVAGQFPAGELASTLLSSVLGVISGPFTARIATKLGKDIAKDVVKYMKSNIQDKIKGSLSQLRGKTDEGSLKDAIKRIKWDAKDAATGVIKKGVEGKLVPVFMKTIQELKENKPQLTKSDHEILGMFYQAGPESTRSYLERFYGIPTDSVEKIQIRLYYQLMQEFENTFIWIEAKGEPFGKRERARALMGITAKRRAWAAVRSRYGKQLKEIRETEGRR